MPSVPTISESGVKGYEVVNWHGLMGPKGLPQAIVERINGEINKSLKSKDMEERLAADGVSPAGGPPEQLTALLRRDIQRWMKVVPQAGVKATE